MSNDLMVFDAPVEPQAGTALATPIEQPSALMVADPSSPTALLHEAVVRGASVEQLKELVGLHERIEERQARKAYFDAMAKFQAKCPPIKKVKTAQFATNSGHGEPDPHGVRSLIHVGQQGRKRDHQVRVHRAACARPSRVRTYRVADRVEGLNVFTAEGRGRAHVRAAALAHPGPRHHVGR